MQQFQKYIATEPQRNRKDLESNNMGSWIINATDIEYIENRSYKGKGENWSLDWLWGGV